MQKVNTYCIFVYSAHTYVHKYVNTWWLLPLYNMPIVQKTKSIILCVLNIWSLKVDDTFMHLSISIIIANNTLALLEL